MYTGETETMPLDDGAHEPAIAPDLWGDFGGSFAPEEMENGGFEFGRFDSWGAGFGEKGNNGGDGNMGAGLGSDWGGDGGGFVGVGGGLDVPLSFGDTGVGGGAGFGVGLDLELDSDGGKEFVAEDSALAVRRAGGVYEGLGVQESSRTGGRASWAAVANELGDGLEGLGDIGDFGMEEPRLGGELAGGDGGEGMGGWQSELLDKSWRDHNNEGLDLGGRDSLVGHGAYDDWNAGGEGGDNWKASAAPGFGGDEGGFEGERSGGGVGAEVDSWRNVKDTQDEGVRESSEIEFA